MDKIICKGSLKQVQAKDAIKGYSKAHLKGMFSTTSSVSIKGTSATFNSMIADHLDGSSISGVQRKIFMTLKENQLIPSNQGEFIVKPTPKDFPQLAENEQAIMKLAQAVGFKTALCSVIPFSDGELAYVTKRFDLSNKQAGRIFVEDGASICNVMPKHKGSDALSYQLCLAQMVAACAGATATAAIAVKMVLFSYIVANNDLHLKNFSLFRKAQSRSHLMDGFSPIYDVLSVAPYPTYDNEYLSLSLLESETDGVFSPSYEHYGFYTMQDFVLLAQATGIKEKIAHKLLITFMEQVIKHSPIIINNSNLTDEFKVIILARIKQRCGNLKQQME